MIQVPDTILKREDRRQGGVQRRHDVEPTQSDVFRETFKEKQSEIDQLLSSVERTNDKLELAEIFDKISRSVNHLSRYLASSSIFLIPYEIKISKSAIQTMLDRSAELEAKYLPRKRFAFKNRKDAVVGVDKKVKEVEKWTVAPEVEEPASGGARAYTVSDQSGVAVRIKHEEIRNKDVTLSKLVDCSVFIEGSPNTLHIVSLAGCRVICGPVATSVLVENCSRSAFAFPCQQLRVHNTTATDFHVHVTTRAIIEDTKDVRFAPFDVVYNQLGAHYIESGLDRARNNWSDVDDFNWLVSNKKSPNWSLVPDAERKTFAETVQAQLIANNP